MKFATHVLAGVAAAVAAVAAIAMQDMPKPVSATNEHKWLSQYKGDWTYEVDVSMGEGAPMMKSTGTEHVDTVGDLWMFSKNTGSMMGMPFTGLLTLGYDTDKKKFIGTWVDSVSTHMWTYQGTLDAAGKILTLESEGPGMTGTPTKFRETIEMKSKDERVFTSRMQNEKGEFVTHMTIRSKRKA